MAKVATKKTTTAKTVVKAAPKQSAAEDYVVLDHPINNETVRTGHYTIRAGASPCDKVEISIDDQPWVPCRHAVGYWWYDWHGYSAGSHQLVARLHKGENTVVSRRRRFKVA